MVQRDQVISIRVSPDERALLEVVAMVKGVSLSELLRSAVLVRLGETDVDAAIDQNIDKTEGELQALKDLRDRRVQS